MALFEYKDNCRLCLKSPIGYMKNVYTHRIEGYQETLVQNIFSLFQVELKAHEDYPQNVCRKCLTELENVLLFKEDLQRNQAFLFDLSNAVSTNLTNKKTTSRRNPYSLDFSNGANMCLKSKDNSFAPDSKNVDDPEFLRVPATYIKQFLPNIKLHRSDLESSKKKLYKCKSESSKSDFTQVSQNKCVNICENCAKVFKSQALLNFHYKKVHKRDYQKQIETETSFQNSTNKSAAKKVKTDKSRKVLTINTSELPTTSFKIESDTLKAELDATVNTLTEPDFHENQANFLQNFNLIARQEAEHIKNIQESPKSLSNRLKRQALPQTKQKTEDVFSKNNLPKKGRITKPKLTHNKQKSKAKNIDDSVLRRSILFLKRYGFRNLDSTSRKNKLLNKQKDVGLFENKNISTKSVTKKKCSSNYSTKGSVVDKNLKSKNNNSKTVLNYLGCESENVFGCTNQTLELNFTNVNNKSINSIESSNKLDLLNEEDKQSRLNKNNFKSDLKPTDTKNLIQSSVLPIKSELITSLKVEDDEFNSISSRNFYNKNISTVNILDQNQDLPNLVLSAGTKTRLLRKNTVNKKLFSGSNYEYHKSKISMIGKPGSSSSTSRDCPRVKSPTSFFTSEDNVEMDIANFARFAEKTQSNLDANDLENKAELQSHLDNKGIYEDQNNIDPSVNLMFVNYDSNTYEEQTDGFCDNKNSVSILRRGRSRKNINDKSLIHHTNNQCKIAKKNSSSRISNTQECTKTNLNIHDRQYLSLNSVGPSHILPSNPNMEVRMMEKNYLNYNPLDTLSVKNEDMPTLHNLNDLYEKHQNMGGKYRRRKAVSCGNIKNLKYETQESEERFQDLNAQIENNDNKFNKYYMYNSPGVTSPKECGLTPEKVVNIDLENNEVQMLVLVSDTEDIDFDQDDITKYVKSNNSLLADSFLPYCQPTNSLEKDSSICISDIDNKNIPLQGSQACLFHMRNKYVNDLNVNDSNINKSIGLTRNNNLSTFDKTPKKRARRMPQRFSPSINHSLKSNQCSDSGLNKNNKYVNQLKQNDHKTKIKTKATDQQPKVGKSKNMKLTTNVSYKKNIKQKQK